MCTVCLENNIKEVLCINIDSVVGLATVFMLGHEEAIETGEGSNSPLTNGGLLSALPLGSPPLLLPLMAYWLNIHHNLKFSPMQMTILQVWCVVFFSLGMVFYPLCISAKRVVNNQPCPMWLWCHRLLLDAD